MKISEDRISNALRNKRISRLRAWWERWTCQHTRDTYDKRPQTDGIDTWELEVYWCSRCGCTWADRNGEKIILEKPA